MRQMTVFVNLLLEIRPKLRHWQPMRKNGVFQLFLQLSNLRDIFLKYSVHNFHQKLKFKDKE
jgi:hypothetical protein